MRHLLLCFAVISASVAAGAQSLESLLEGIDPAAVAILQEEGEVFRVDRNQAGLIFVPDTPSAGEIYRSFQNLGPDVVTEALYLIPYTDEIDSVNLELYRLLRNVEDISDVIYHSSRRDAYIPLFDDVYPIESENRRKKVELQEVDSIPPSETLYLYMDEVNLGSAYYSLDYEFQEDTMMMTLKNSSVIRKVVKIADKGEFDIKLNIIPVDEGFLVYGLCQVKLSNRNLVNNMLDPYSAFYKRMYALEIWIYNTLHGTDKRPDFRKPFEG